MAIEEDLLQLAPDEFATRWVLEALPHCFAEGDSRDYWQWKTEFATHLDVDPKNLLITGSGAAGVSLNPFKGLREFNEHSDIDVAVISTFHFDLAWRTLRNLGSKRYQLTTLQKRAVKEHVERYIYWGTIATDRILPILPFAGPWMEAIDLMQNKGSTGDRTINLRVYRDFSSLRSYLTAGVRKLRENRLTA